jgi:hypothetical protein
MLPHPHREEWDEDESMRALLVSEGKHESSGALQALVQRTAPQITSCTWMDVKCEVIHTHRGQGQGFFKRAVRWILEARKRGFDVLVLVIDEDGKRKRVGEIADAQSESRVTDGMPRALGTAIRTFDAWMLADEGALSSILAVHVDRQRSPEEIADPKAICAALLAQSDCELWQREMYADIAKRIDLALLEQRCPKGFGPFAERLRLL